ncbi:MAG: type I phosphomannose isomerase catalytic subunit [Candidatus Baltobacteraceae bacterium]
MHESSPSAPVGPLPLEPREVEAIWGGDTLVRRFGKRGDPKATIGESWECWDDDRVAGGAFAGATIAALRERLGARLLGRLDPTRLFPLLTKFIDARLALSVQVHPDDAYARRVEGQPNGKTECWYVLSADPAAELVLGWARATSREEYLTRVADGSLGDLLRRVPVQAGQAFYLPAGTLHAIGPGIVLYEVQQTSDLTYRIFDWNRLGADGKPRALHVEKAADVLDYHAGTAGALRSLEYRDGALQRTALVADAHFVFERIAVGADGGTFDLGELPLVVTALDAGIELRTESERLALAPYATALVPAGARRCSVRATEGETLILTSAPDANGVALRARLSESGTSRETVERFFAQFA